MTTISICPAGYRRVNSIHEHRRVAETALGRPLPKGAVVHHINHDKQDNRNCNLVICNSEKHHKKIHYREKALDACGNSDFVKCTYCKEWGPQESMYVRSRPRLGFEARHRSCHATANRKSSFEGSK